MSTTDLGNKKIFSNNLQTFIDRQNLTVPQLAEKLGIKYTTFRDWVKGNTYPRIDKIELLADYFGVKKSALVEHHDNGIPLPIHSYPYFDADIAAGSLTTVEGLESAEQIQISDTVMGKYAGDSDLFVTNINGESMNRVILNGSLVVVKAIDSFQDLSDGEVVIFCEDEESYSVKRFYNDSRTHIINFTPDSTDSTFRPINFRYEDMDDVRIIGRVVKAVVDF